jgi:hypothetical protein
MEQETAYILLSFMGVLSIICCLCENLGPQDNIFIGNDIIDDVIIDVRNDVIELNENDLEIINDDNIVECNYINFNE